MAQITLVGKPIHTIGELPQIGEQAKDFELIAKDLSRVNLGKYKGSKLLLNIFPSLDTGTCAMSVRNFNKAAAELENIKVLCISRDTPFAQARFCGAEGLENVETLSDMATGQFGIDYGLRLIDSPMKDFNSRVVIILDENHKIIYTEQVPELSHEPNYEAALKVLA
jgi:thioredoxin-dependent peroxiredoxin